MNTGGTKKLILVVEDDRAIRDSIIEILSEEGFDPQGAENGKHALEVLATSQQIPDAIILDLMMPVMDGYEFRNQQMMDSKIKNIPIIVITADGNAKSKAHFLNAQAWVKKPIELASLLVNVHSVCQSEYITGRQ